MSITIAVAAHKPCPLPTDEMYLPVHAGAALGGGVPITRDDSGDHISCRNPGYCELTVHYWLWKNHHTDVYGLCHYRRYFALRRRGPKMARILTKQEAQTLLEDADVIVPTPRWYLIETNYSQYVHAHHTRDLTVTRQVIAQLHPAFLPAYDRVMKRRWGRRFNMCIMRRAQFDAYSQWLFSILFAAEEQLSALSPDNNRVYGYIAERLMDVWLEHTRPRMRQCSVVNLESQHWPKKILSFLRRRFVSNERLENVKCRKK